MTRADGRYDGVIKRKTAGKRVRRTIVAMREWCRHNRHRPLEEQCEGDSRNRLRDRTMILLLARLGLRAGDVASMRMVDLDWGSSTVRVCGKGR